MKTGIDHFALGIAAAAVIWVPIVWAHGSSESDAKSHVIRLVAKIQRDDYEGNRAGLKSDYSELAPFVGDANLSAPVHYWRAFALWRRAINGFNEKFDPKEQELDLRNAIDEFAQIPETDALFVEGRIGTLSCLGNLLYLAGGNDPTRVQALIAQIVPVSKSTKAIAPENPRLFWVMGPTIWASPPERGGGQDKAIANYERGLELSRKSPPATDPLQPSWGEAELFMNLAWSQLNGTKPDLENAERNARAALAIIPYWHYVNDILLPQILAAQTKQAGK
jgi:hypothetical protein